MCLDYSCSISGIASLGDPVSMQWKYEYPVNGPFIATLAHKTRMIRIQIVPNDETLMI